MLSSFLLRRAFHGIQVCAELRTHPFDVKLMVIVRLSSGSYRVRLMVDKGTRPVGCRLPRMPLFSPAQLFFQFYLRMTDRKDARTLRKPVKCQASNSLLFNITFGAQKASHGHLMNDEVG